MPALKKKKKVKYFQHTIKLYPTTLFQHKTTRGHLTACTNKSSLVTSFILCIYSNA